MGWADRQLSVQLRSYLAVSAPICAIRRDKLNGLIEPTGYCTSNAGLPIGLLVSTQSGVVGRPGRVHELNLKVQDRKGTYRQGVEYRR